MSYPHISPYRPKTVYWCAADALHRIWFDGSADRVRRWIVHTNAVAGFRTDAPPLFRSEDHGCGWPLPREFA